MAAQSVTRRTTTEKCDQRAHHTCVRPAGIFFLSLRYVGPRTKKGASCRQYMSQYRGGTCCVHEQYVLQYKSQELGLQLGSTGVLPINPAPLLTVIDSPNGLHHAHGG